MTSINSPKHLKAIEKRLHDKLKQIKAQTQSELFETQQLYHDEVLEVHKEALQSLIDGTVTYSKILVEIKQSYENALHIRNKRIEQFITQDKVYGISVRKNQRDDKIKSLDKELEVLKEQNLKLNHEISKLKKDMGKLKDNEFSDYLMLMRERDARYTLYFENVGLQLKLKELDGSTYQVDEAYGDPIVLRIALDRCREQLSATQSELTSKREQYSQTVPRRSFDELEARYGELARAERALQAELQALRADYDKLLGEQRGLEEELSEVRERCAELERAGSPRPHWDMCADFIGGGRDRWRQLASGLSSRDILRVLLKELGPAAENDNLEHFEGLGMDPEVPAYLRYCGKVRNLRLSRRELAVLLHDIWQGKAARRDLSLQDYVTLYFQERYQQPSMRAEWAYNMCASAEQMLDEPQVKLFWGVLHGHLSEDIYWGLAQEWRDLKHQLYRNSKDKETLTVEEFEKSAKAQFPLKSDVEVRELGAALRAQLKLKPACTHFQLDKLFQENAEGFARGALGLVLLRQRRAAQARYTRELLARLPRRRPAAPADLRRAIALVDPAIDHIRMERYLRWAFSEARAELPAVAPRPLAQLAARLAAGDIARAGPRRPALPPPRAR